MKLFIAVASLVFAVQVVNADESNIALSFWEATEKEPHNSKFYHLNGCVFEKITVVPEYCEATGLGSGGRTVRQLIDLSEVDEMRVSWFESEIKGEPARNLHTRFRLDLPTPDAGWVLRDRLMNGPDGARDRYMEKIGELRAGMEMNSKMIATTCSGDVQETEPFLAFITANRPKGIEALAQLAKECRGSAPFEFVDEGE